MSAFKKEQARYVQVKHRDWQRLQAWSRASGRTIEETFGDVMAAERVRRREFAGAVKP